MPEATANQLAPVEPVQKADLLQKIFGFLNFAAGAASLIDTGFVTYSSLESLKNGFANSYSSTVVIVYGVHLLITLALSVLFVVFGIRLIRNERRHAGLQTNSMIALAAANLLSTIMLTGFAGQAWGMSAILMYLVLLHVKVDPSLNDERKLQHKLEQMETRKAAEEGTLGRDTTGKGYLKLDFFNMFWIFTICCVAGVAFETLYCYIDRGVIENRTGLLWGWFSPIYGVGGLLVSAALNRFYRSNILITFVVSAIIGAGFEFFVSWFFETSFAIKAWDYSGSFMNLDGRTDLFHAVAWGIMGTIWVRYLIQLLLKLINRIPWQWRYAVTAVCAAFMITNCVMTMLSINCWVNRVNGVGIEAPIENFFAKRYPNDWMQTHFETMKITPTVK